MGLNLETLIGILVILILLILADGIRRMLRDRGRRLKVRIDPRVRDYSSEPVEERNPELLGGPRVVTRNRAPDAQPDSEPGKGRRACDAHHGGITAGPVW